MNAAVPVERGRFQGVSEIIAFNWHWYAAGAFAAVAVVVALALVEWPAWVRVVAVAGITAASVWSIASLAVSHWVYDRSGLREWLWLRRAIAQSPHRWCNLHCGLDESSSQLRELFPDTCSTVLDIFDPVEMTEASILRARKGSGGTGSTAVNFRKLPLESETMDAVFLLFAAHELRKPRARDELFAEVRRVLRAGGEVVVAEHLRDMSNFAAFGPGAFHFFSAREWRRVFSDADLQVRTEFNITPFVRVFMLRRAL